jgi:hypothetical protein
VHTRFVDGGISYNGGYTDYVITPTEAVASILDELSAREAARRDQIQAYDAKNFPFCMQIYGLVVT